MNDEGDPLFGADEDPLDLALVELDGRAAALGAALRRAIPFLFRDGVAVVADPATSRERAAIEADLAPPRHFVPLVTGPAIAPAGLWLDATAIAFLLDGALGGDGSSPPALAAEGITGPQRALLGRIVAGVVPAFCGPLEAGLGLRLERPAPGSEPAQPETVVELRFRLGEAGASGTVVLTFAREALLAAVTPGKKPSPTGGDPVLTAALGAVELELVVELGRVRLTLHELASLHVGDVLDVATPVGAAVPVRVDSRVLFRGHPITSGTHVAVRVATPCAGAAELGVREAAG